MARPEGAALDELSLPTKNPEAPEKEVLLMIRRTIERVWPTAVVVLIACATLLQSGAMSAAQVAVRHTEGVIHGFLVLRTLAGEILADGDLMEPADRRCEKWEERCGS